VIYRALEELKKLKIEINKDKRLLYYHVLFGMGAALKIE
jgi:hypothetical protein